MKLDSLHCALLVAIVLLAVYGFGRFREGAQCLTKPHCTVCKPHRPINSKAFERDGKWCVRVPYEDYLPNAAITGPG